jgi:REP element-mobilizing transposase RayT
MQKPAREQGRYTQLKGITMLDDYGLEIYEENPFPIAYLLTFRTYGTWLHGDDRFSVGRNGNNRYGGPKIQASVPLKEVMIDKSSQSAVILSGTQRKLVGEAITEVCSHRGYLLRALNIRSNHLHSVVSMSVNPEKIVNDFKAYSTRMLRSDCQVSSDQKVWSRGASTRYLWKPRHVEAAVDYVLYCQENIPFEFKD